MKNNTEDGIILRTYQSGDANLVLRVITKNNGKLILFAPFAKKSTKKLGKLDILDFGSFTYEEKQNEFKVLKEFQCYTSFPQLRNSLDKIIIATFLAEVFDIFVPENDPHSQELFDLFFYKLQEIEIKKELKYDLKLLFEAIWSLLTFSGHKPKKQYIIPSYNNLKSLIELAEGYAEKKFETTKEIIIILDRLKKK